MGTDTVTQEEAASLLGLAFNTVKAYRSKGILTPVPGTERQGVATLFYREQVEEIAARPSYAEQRRQKRDAVLAAGEKECTRCNIVKSLDCFQDQKNGLGGKRSHCILCLREVARGFAQKYRDKRIAYKREYRQREREKVKAYKREYQRRLNREKGPAYKRMRAYQNRYQKAYQKAYRRLHKPRDRSWYWRLLRAMEEGKTSPICRETGFSIVVNRENGWRAARLDKRLEEGEKVLTHYYWIGSAKTWAVLAPPIRDKQTERITRFCSDREKRRRKMKVK